MRDGFYFLTGRIQIKLDAPEREWETVNAWFVRQKHMDVKLAHRPVGQIWHGSS